MLAEGFNLVCASARAAWQMLIHILMGYQVVRWLIEYYQNVTNSAEQQQVQRGFGANARDGEEAEAETEAAGETETGKECIKISAIQYINATAVMGNAGSSSSSNSRSSRSRSNSTRNKSLRKRHSEV